MTPIASKLFAPILCFFVYQLNAQTTNTVFEDDFETHQTWGIFEEIVSGNSCYADNIGEVSRSTDFTKNGLQSLRVWSNKTGVSKSNHVIASHHIFTNQGITGRYRYAIDAYVNTTIGLTQSAPEISVQNTRQVGVQNLTYIMGIQYIGNQWITNKWNIWHNGTWQAILPSEFGLTLSYDTWYHMEIEFDFTTNEYISLTVQGGSINMTLNLQQVFQNASSGFKIGGETRNWTPSLFVTAESENLWTNCSEVRDNKVYYDNVKLLEVLSPLPVELVNFTVNPVFNNIMTHQLTWQTADEHQNEGFNIQISVDSKAFVNVGYLKGVGKPHTYQYNYTPISTGVVYYRLEQIDTDGQKHYSKIISVEVLQKTHPLSISPNPAQDVVYFKSAWEKATLTVYNAMGSIVYQHHFENNGQHMWHTEAMSRGLYFAHLNVGNVIEKIYLQ